MTTIKQYEITWNAHEDAPVLTVEIDHDICTYEHLHQINNFFCGHKHRLSDNDGDITVTVLKMLAAEVIPPFSTEVISRIRTFAEYVASA
ncbi:DUF2528 family protein [Serratia liquefaciens]|uniref:DUF2528 family protein n=1 Tax=Serratia liquefaciens TaxID=614 RepID=UPI002182DD1D|nr:Protein of uncharacterised function (DUF2528) [Serratia liquefaciens]